MKIITRNVLITVEKEVNVFELTIRTIERVNASIIRRKVLCQERGNKKTKYAKFPVKINFSYPLIRLFLEKFGVLFSCYFKIHPFALLPMNGQ